MKEKTLREHAICSLCRQKIGASAGLQHDGETIKGFTARCEQCHSQNVSIIYLFDYYGGATGYDQSLSLKCRECKQETELHI